MQYNEENPYPVTVASDEEFKAVETIFNNHWSYHCPEKVVPKYLKPPKHIKAKENYDKKFMVMSVNNKQAKATTAFKEEQDKNHLYGTDDTLKFSAHVFHAFAKVQGLSHPQIKRKYEAYVAS